MAAWQGWETQLLNQINAPVTQANIDFLDAWQNAEKGTANYNPLNTTQKGTGSWNYNSAGVQSFPNANSGIFATKQTLQNGYYPSIMQALLSGNPLSQQGAELSAELKKWGTGDKFLSSIGGVSVSQSSTASNSASGGGGNSSAGSNSRGDSNTSSTSTKDWLGQLEDWGNGIGFSLAFASLAIALVSGGIIWLAASNPQTTSKVIEAVA